MELSRFLRGRWSSISVLLLVVLLAAVLRFVGLNWDSGHHLHPDERFLTMVGVKLSVPESFSQYLDPANSSLNPYNSDFKFFVYGTLPLTLNKLIVHFFSADNYQEFNLYGRALSAAFDLTILLFVFLIVRLWERPLGLKPSVKFLCAFFYAICVFSIQQAHFFSVDSFGACFSFAACYFSLRHHYQSSWWSLVFCAIFSGATLACKITGLTVFPLVMTFLCFSSLVKFNRKSVSSAIVVSIPRLILFLLIAYLTLRISDPRFFSNSSFLNPRLNPQFVRNLKQLNTSNDPAGFYPPGIQWLSKTPIIFSLQNIAVFGLGPACFILMLIGGVTVFAKRHFSALISVLWVLGYFVVFSARQVQTMRYFYVLYPFFMILAGVGYSKIGQLISKPRCKNTVFILVISTLLLWPLSFIQIYLRPHSRVTASKWIYQNIPAGAVLALEHWDDPLPLRLRGYLTKYKAKQLEVFGPDDDKKWRKMTKILQQADYLIFSSNRGYGSIMKVPKKYPRMSVFYRELFSGKGKFEKIKEITSYPTLNLGLVKFELADQWGEEAFTVYDHPKITIFRRKSR